VPTCYRREPKARRNNKNRRFLRVFRYCDGHYAFRTCLQPARQAAVMLQRPANSQAQTRCCRQKLAAAAMPRRWLAARAASALAPLVGCVGHERRKPAYSRKTRQRFNRHYPGVVVL